MIYIKQVNDLECGVTYALFHTCEWTRDLHIGLPHMPFWVLWFEVIYRYVKSQIHHIWLVFCGAI